MLELNKIYNMNCLDGLKLLDDESINCCVTSPPYWGLRDYGTAQWVGGDINCDHIKQKNSMQSDKSTLGGRKSEQTLNDKRRDINTPYKDICGKCGAIRIDGQFGLEETPEEYVANMVKVFSEVKRVLRKDGTLWLNLGDSYVGGGNNRGNNSPLSKMQAGNKGAVGQCAEHAKNIRKIERLKSKDLVGIPWRVAFALQQDGWYLRQDIIWHKPNPMPESVTDRCTKSHEYIFLLAKSAHYYYDNEAISEPQIESSLERLKRGWNGNGDRGFPLGAQNHLKNYFNKTDDEIDKLNGRNKRSVWTVTTKPFKEAHFATFPEDLIKPCILAGCPEQGIVLDPFMGAGTTGLVATKRQRNFIGFELNKEYIDIANARIEPYLAQQSLFEEAENAELRSEANKLIDLLGGE